MKTTTRSLMVTASLGALLQGLPAYAQSDVAQPAAEQPAGLDDIVVTAQRRSESAQKAGIPINVVTAAALQTAGVADTTALNRVAPALYITRGGGALTSFFIRGVGNFSNNSYSDPAVAFNYDGVYVARPSATVTSFFDLERIEVLKGPQGTLYGRNATGGAVNVIPAKPDPKSFAASVALGYGNYDSFDADGMVNVPLGPNAAFRVSGRLARNDGYNLDGTDDTNAEALRGQLYFESGNVDVRLSADYSHLGGLGPGGSFVGAVNFAPGAPASNSVPANFIYAPVTFGDRQGLFSPAARSYFGSLVNVGTFNRPGPIADPFIDNENWGVHAELNVQTSLGKLTVIPAYRKGLVNNRFSGPAFRAGWTVEDGQQTSIEARFAGERVGPVDWLIGGIYFHETIDGQSAFNQYVVENLQDYSLSNKSWALFGKATFNLSDRVRLTGGLRYTKDDKSIDARNIAVINQCTNPVIPPNFAPCLGGPSIPVGLTLDEVRAAIPASDLPAGFPPAPFVARPFGVNGNIILYAPSTTNKSLSNGQVTYRVALEADVFENSLAYISYETGYRSGGFSLTLGRETFDPEFIKAFTVGLKNRFLDNRFQLNIEGFYWRYRDQQLSHLGLDAIGNSSFFTENIGRSTIWGVDVDAAFQAEPGTVISAGAQYLNTDTSDFVYTTPDTNNVGIPPATGCASRDDGAFFTVNCSGRPLLNSPRWALNAGVEQTFEFGDHKLVFNANGRYRSNRVIGFDYLALGNSGETFEADASITFAQIDDRWAITAWIRNLADEKIPALTQYNSISGGVVTTVYQPPRTYGLRASIKF